MKTEHKVPKMSGIFKEQAENFISFKRNLGFKYQSEEKVMSRFCRFSEGYDLPDVRITRELAEDWAAPRTGEACKSRAHRLTCVRQFGEYLNNLGYKVYFLPGQRGIWTTSFVPYIFTHKQIQELFAAVDNTKFTDDRRTIQDSLPIIFRMLYGCGLRVSEALKLQVKDVDLANGILTIKETKMDRDRLIPMSGSLTEVCTKYADKTWWDKDTDYFFMAPDHTMISPNTVYGKFRIYLRAMGIPHGGKGQGPRLHDLRHTFAVHALQGWVTGGNDLTTMLPLLSVYMGHKSVRATSRYLSLEGTKALLEQPDPTSPAGRRDGVLLTLMYDTGCRVQELVDLRVCDVTLADSVTVKLTGKGGKSRIVPVMSPTGRLIRQYIEGNHLDTPLCRSHPLFTNRPGKKMTRAGVTYILQKYAGQAHISGHEDVNPKLTPHCLRHSKAMHLLQSGINLIYIRDLLGHSDISTTEVYARADEKMKREALENAYESPSDGKMPSWQEDNDLLNWLKNFGK